MCYFTGIFISLFGTGMNFAGVTLYVLGKTHSTVQVSFTVILLTLPRLVVPPFGGVLTDRVDRRYLSIASISCGRRSFSRRPHSRGGESSNSGSSTDGVACRRGIRDLLVVEPGAAAGTDSGAAVGERQFRRADRGAGEECSRPARWSASFTNAPGLAGILAIDGATYVLSAVLFLFAAARVSSSHARPRNHALSRPQNQSVRRSRFWKRCEPNPARGVLRDIEEGLHYLRTQPTVLALGLTYACMMAGVISANVLVVALASDLLHVGARGYGFIEAGWALGAVLEDSRRQHFRGGALLQC